MARLNAAAGSSKFLTLASICVVVAALYFAQDVLIPLALAVMFTFLLSPLVRRLERVRVPRVGAVITVVVSAFLLLGILGWLVATQTIELANNLDRYRDNIAAKVEVFRPRGGLFEKLSRTAAVVEKRLEAPATTQATQPVVAMRPPPVGHPLQNVTAEAMPPMAPLPTIGAPQMITPPTTHPAAAPVPVVLVQGQHSPIEQLWQYLGLALGKLGTAGLVIVFVLFMLLQREDLRDRVIRLVGYGNLTVTTQALDDAAERISRYLLMQAIVNGTYGCTIGIGLWIIGKTVGHSNPSFPNVVLWGLLCAVLRFIPYIGPWIGAAFPMLVALAVYQGWSVFAWTLGLFVGIELISNNVMEPLLYGASTGLSTVAILVAAVFWTWLWGPIGLVLSTPLTVCLVVIGKYVPQFGFLDIMLGDQPVLAPHERVYQRWLAMDHEEVAELVGEFLKTSSLEEIYDNVFLPALALAEQDRHRGLLDEERRKFIRRSLRDLIDELADDQRVTFARTGAGPGEKPGEVAPRRRMRVAKECVINVITLPAHDEADEIAGLMLTQLLGFAGYCAKNLTTDSLAAEMMERVLEHEAHIVVLSAVPPDAVTHARYICKRLMSKHPEIHTVIGLWKSKADLKRARERIACAESVQIVTSLSQAMDLIEQIAQPIMMSAQTDAAKAQAAAVQ